MLTLEEIEKIHNYIDTLKKDGIITLWWGSIYEKEFYKEINSEINAYIKRSHSKNSFIKIIEENELTVINTDKITIDFDSCYDNDEVDNYYALRINSYNNRRYAVITQWKNIRKILKILLKKDPAKYGESCKERFLIPAKNRAALLQEETNRIKLSIKRFNKLIKCVPEANLITKIR